MARLPESSPLWERAELRSAAGETLRPGGFALTDRAAELAGVLPGWRVLDVGCGLGATVRRLRSRFGALACGVEPSPVQLERSRVSGVVRASGESLPFANGVFRAVFCECVLSLFPDPSSGLREFRRVLTPGGALVLSDVCLAQGGTAHLPGNASRPLSSQETASAVSCACGAVPLERTLALLARAGFGVELVEDHSQYLKQLAGRLVFAGAEGVGGTLHGMAGEERGGRSEASAGCGCDERRLGYFLVIARNQGAEDV